MKLAESYAYFCTPYSSFCILTWGHKSKNHVSLVMTMVEPSNIYFARMSNKTKLLLCNLFLYAYTKLFLYKWKLIRLLAVNIYSSIHQFIVPSILMICENAVLPWTFSSVSTLPLNSLFSTNQLMDDDFQTSCYTWLHSNSWLQVFTSESLDAPYEVPLPKTHLNIKTCVAD